MLTADGPKVIEFNVRLGDPEAQVVLSRIAEPLLPLLVAGAAGRLYQPSCRLTAECLVGVVMASRGYPESSESGRAIDGVADAEQMPGVCVFHAATAILDGRLVTAGGRVLTVVGSGSDFTEAIRLNPKDAEAYYSRGNVKHTQMKNTINLRSTHSRTRCRCRAW
jgi:phosphoribosylamine--glycine ligase